jgi:hypothetical protein
LDTNILGRCCPHLQGWSINSLYVTWRKCHYQIPEDWDMAVKSLYLVWRKCHYLIPDDWVTAVHPIPQNLSYGGLTIISGVYEVSLLNSRRLKSEVTIIIWFGTVKF